MFIVAIILGSYEGNWANLDVAVQCWVKRFTFAFPRRSRSGCPISPAARICLFALGKCYTIQILRGHDLEGKYHVSSAARPSHGESRLVGSRSLHSACRVFHHAVGGEGESAHFRRRCAGRGFARRHHRIPDAGRSGIRVGNAGRGVRRFPHCLHHLHGRVVLRSHGRFGTL